MLLPFVIEVEELPLVLAVAGKVAEQTIQSHAPSAQADGSVEDDPVVIVPEPDGVQ